MQIGILINPHSRKNHRQQDREQYLRRLVGPGAVVRQTSGLAGIRSVLSEFIDLGLQYWVSDGGDGTFHWMLNEGREALEQRGLQAASLPQLVPTNGGTIDFVAKKVGIAGRADDIIRALVAGVRQGSVPKPVELDTLEVLGHRPGDPADTFSFRKLGFAIAIGGIGQRFFAKYYSEPGQGPWTILRVIFKTMLGTWGSLPLIRSLPLVSQQLRQYGHEVLAGTRAQVTADGRNFPYDVYQGLHAGAIDVDFGTIKLFRYASQSRRMHLVVGALTPLQATYRWSYMLAGIPIRSPQWHEFAGQQLDVRAVDEEGLNPVIDGELFHGFDRLQVRLGPPVLVPPVLIH